MAIVQTQQMQEASNAAAVTTAEAEATAAMAEKAAGEEAPAVVPSDSATDHPNENADEWHALTDEFENKVVEEAEDVQAAKPIEDPEQAVPPTDEVVKPVEEEKPAAADATPTDAVVKPDDGVKPADDVLIPVVPQEQDTRSSEQVQADMNTARKAARDSLVESFKLTEQQVDEFREDPNAVLPQMAADLYLDIYNNLMENMGKNIPHMMTGLMQQQQAQQAHEQAFYNAWPQLAKGEYVDTVQRISQNYHALNPKADAETAIKEIGAQAWVTLRLPVEELMAHTQKAPVITAAVVPTPNARVPANAGNVPASAHAQVTPPLNGFAQLAEEFIEDDLS